MGQFKPMVKMYTTEPTIELKLKKGGHAKMPKMKTGGDVEGHKPMMNGGVMDRLARTPAMIGRPAVNAMVKTPGKPSMSDRRKAMKPMKEGGETAAEHKAEMKKMSKTAEALKEHAAKPASKAHKGLKKGGLAACATGGVVMGQGGYKTGGVVKGQGGYAKGGIINTENQGGEYRNTKMVTAKPDMAKGKTGEVVKGAGGYKKGGAPKKYQAGGVTEVERQIVRQAPAQGMTTDRESEIMRGFRRRPEMPAILAPRQRRMTEEQLGAGMMSDEERRMLQDMVRRDISRPAMKKGGAAKKAGGGACYANGGSVNDSGKAEKMPQGNKKAAPTIRVSALSGTFKKGGLAQTSAEKRLNKVFQKENAPAMKAAKKMSNEKYGKR